MSTSFSELSPEHSFFLKVPSELAGCRLDHFLVRAIPGVSRAHLVEAVRGGLVRVDNVLRKSSYSLKGGESIEGALVSPAPLGVVAEEVDFQILYEDSSLLVLSKPPGLVVHPGSGNQQGTLVSGLVFHCSEIAGIGDDISRPGLVHRLDKDTSGLMVVAKEEEAHRRLVDAFKARKVEKEYVALLHGSLKNKEGRIVASIGRHPVHRQKMAIRENGRFAATRWELIQEFSSGFSLVRLLIETGRTHQIRVHMASLGHPVAGDRVYGSGRRNEIFSRQMLHSSRLCFAHPVTGEQLEFVAPVWADFAGILDRLRGETSANGEVE